MHLSKLCFGTGGRFGRLEYSQAFDLVRFAYSKGVTVFDTGLEYCKGISQPLLYRSLLKLGVHRQSYSVCSKVSSSTLREFDVSSIAEKLLSGFQSELSFIDTLMLWGPSLDDLLDVTVLDKVRCLRSEGVIKRIGVNTHSSKVMEYLISSPDLFFVDDLMIDFNILQNNRRSVVEKFAGGWDSRRVWAGTVLCQGFLLQSLISLYLRTRSFSYLARALFNPPTRVYLRRCSPIRRQLRRHFGSSWRRVPLSFALNNAYVSYVPMGMLSKRSIAANVSIANSPEDGDLISSFLNSLPDSLFVGDVFT